MEKKYNRINFEITEDQLIDKRKLELIKFELIKIKTFFDLLNNEDASSFNVYESYISHLNKEESITTAQIEGSKITELDLAKSYVKSESKDSEKQEIIKRYANEVVEQLNMQKLLSDYKLILNDLPFSERFLKEMHKTLFRNIKGERFNSSLLGEFKRTNNKLENKATGELIFIPASLDILHEELSAWEKLANQDVDLGQRIINSGILHAWFERIHPFDDGNGRVGRAFIPFYMSKAEETPNFPIVFISKLLREKQTEYYEKLNSIQTNQSYLEFLDFYLDILLESLQRMNTYLFETNKYKNKLEVKLSESNIKFTKENKNLLINIFNELSLFTIEEFKDRITKWSISNQEKMPSDPTIRKILKELEVEEVLEVYNRKPYIYKLKRGPKILI